ncbi:MAG: multiheme c-type cytochrome [Thermodesulfobacteriota bacterium]
MHYVSSSQCRECHPSHYDGWQDSLHPTMFHPVADKKILADFSKVDFELPFTRQDIDFVVGTKWEQLYVTMIDGEYYPLPAKWLIDQKRWVKYRTETWRDTPMSKKCNGCHVTGFQSDTLEFNEFGIGCEACHGPGSIHVHNRTIEDSSTCRLCHRKERVTKGDIVRSVSGAVCGQCHNRGRDIPDSAREQFVFNFPVNMAPGETISPTFTPTTLKNDKENKFWWGNGIARQRHQEFAEWEKSNHAIALEMMREQYVEEKGPITGQCLSCHSADYILSEEPDRPDLHSASYGITCTVCHSPHGSYTSVTTQEKSRRCLPCHDISHESCPSPTQQPHFPCPETRIGCEDCHMPYTVKNAGAFTIRSHGFKIISPSETRTLSVPNSCQNGGCHQDKSLDWAEQQFKQFYPDFGAATN